MKFYIYDKQEGKFVEIEKEVCEFVELKKYPYYRFFVWKDKTNHYYLTECITGSTPQSGLSIEAVIKQFLARDISYEKFTKGFLNLVVKTGISPMMKQFLQLSHDRT